MDDIFDSELARSIKEEVEANLRLVHRLAPTSKELTHAQFIPMNGVLRTLTTGEISYQNTRTSLAGLLLQLHAKISEDSADNCDALSLNTFTRIFAVGMERVLSVLPKVGEDATVNKAEGEEDIFDSLWNERLRTRTNWNIIMIGRSTALPKEHFNVLLNAMVDVIAGGEMSTERTRASLSALLHHLQTNVSEDYGENNLAVSVLAFSKVFAVGMERLLPLLPSMGVEAADNEASLLESYGFFVPQTRVEAESQMVERSAATEGITPGDSTPQQQRELSEGPPEEPQEENGNVEEGGQKALNQDDFMGNYNDGMENNDSLIPDDAQETNEETRGARVTRKKNRPVRHTARKTLPKRKCRRENKQNLAVIGMTDSEMMEFEGSDSSSASDSGSENDEPTAKKLRPLDHDESVDKRQSKRARKQSIQQKNRPLKGKTSKTLPKGNRRESKEVEAEGAVPAEDGEEVDTTTVKTDDKQKCQLCGAKPSHPSWHVASFHLKKHLFTCPVCVECGDTRAYNVAQHIRTMHPFDVGKKPVSHVEKYSAEMQRLQAMCFPKLQLKISRPMKNTSHRSTCMLCSEKVDTSHRQSHVFGKHFKKAGLFDCPLCVAPRPTFKAVREHIRRHHQKDYGKIQPISHEKEFEKEISALNQQCFPGWVRRKDGGAEKCKKKTLARKEDSESEEKNESEEEEMSSGMEPGLEEEEEWKGAWKKCAKGTLAMKTPSKRRKTRAEGEEEMEEGEEGASGSGLH